MKLDMLRWVLAAMREEDQRKADEDQLRREAVAREDQLRREAKEDRRWWFEQGKSVVGGIAGGGGVLLFTKIMGWLGGG
jgi:hypothetical protein